jgi:hypothetical protein
MIQRTSYRSSVLAVLCLVVLAACGGSNSNPMNATPGQGIVLQGALSGNASAQSGASSAATVTVRVLEQPSISTTIGADGSFTLRGLPQQGFSLVFSEAGGEIGRLGFDGVAANKEITIRVKVTSSGVTLLDERRDGIGHGNVEIEGRVTEVLSLKPNADSRFVIDGYTVVARPGKTAIRRGNIGLTPIDIIVGMRVHVNGEWIPTLAASQPQEVLALEIVIQS